ncbi:hypothetical protein A2363_01495 [Candidatus Gottesmanbacteria bacterium RIFOXYB1_FULL_47_11]|uniref:TPM domain-containing protein n=1 Tax=Candidatus Gottesmanbacteria bacterium RIFOXYB1_FULL_47_11 TaxID=1798401 RepID=A0A1F6BG46_9BACT|nr:MAG: hypothetical protein A2363_01495 [Candidatus Gottesmanbacteria bacterium RIFOXYB1_FULL_47_11]
MKKLFLLFFILVLVGCSSKASPTPQGNRDSIPGQPAFPSLVQYWVVDNGCNFSQEAKENAFEVFDALNRDHIAQVAVVCQTGIKGGPADASTWISHWFNYVGLGSLEDKRAVAVLIRPDVKPEDYRITINPNDALYWFTSYDELPIKQEAADFANYGDFDGCLESLVRNLDGFLRAKWATYGPTSNP